MYPPLVQEDCGPAFQSFPSRPKTKRSKFMSKVAHGEVKAGIAKCKRETRVRNLDMVERDRER